MESLERLRAILRRLRLECPWDRVQTHQSLRSCLLEECAELLEALDSLDESGIVEELGDVLLQVLFHAQLGEEAGTFSLGDVVERLSEKLVRRHPHVFGDSKCGTLRELKQQWEEVKAEEGKVERAWDLPPLLPSLARAQSLARRELEREIGGGSHLEKTEAREAGEALYAWVWRCEVSGLDAEAVLREYLLRRSAVNLLPLGVKAEADKETGS